MSLHACKTNLWRDPRKVVSDATPEIRFAITQHGMQVNCRLSALFWSPQWWSDNQLYFLLQLLEFKKALFITYVLGSKGFRPDQIFKVTNKTTLLFFNIVSLYFNILFNWYINLTIDGTTYPSQHFPFGAAFVCQAGNFWTVLRTLGFGKIR